MDNLSLEVQKGEIFGIVGPDGAGKTTTLRMLSGIMDPTSGMATIAGFDTRTQSFGVKEKSGLHEPALRPLPGLECY